MGWFGKFQNWLWEVEEPLTPEEFFFECKGDVLDMLEKVDRDWDQGITWAQYAYVMRLVLKEHHRLLSLHNGSASISKIDGEGSTPFDSA